MAVAISSDGSTAIVGASFDDVGSNPDQVQQTVFRRSGGVWIQEQQLTPIDGMAGRFFWYVHFIERRW